MKGGYNRLMVPVDWLIARDLIFFKLTLNYPLIRIYNSALNYRGLAVPSLLSRANAAQAKSGEVLVRR